MFQFFGDALGRALKASGLTKEEMAYRVLPHFLLEIITRYLRVETEGIRHVPSEGPAILIANHSGYMGFDALMLGHQVRLHVKRLPRVIAHKLWFLRPEISVHAYKMGAVPATLNNGLKILEKDQMLLLFPEGEEGNFKPSSKSYRLRRFRRGFVRLALLTGAPIIPSIVIGAEETHITLSQIRWAKELVGIIIPVPLNILPLPAKWTIKFLEPIYLGKDPAKANDVAYVSRVARQVRHRLQREIHAELKKRMNVYL